MTTAFIPGAGTILSADIAVPEHEREARFYSRVLSTGARPLWREDLMNNLGIPVIGLGARTPEYAELPLQWMPHMQVADVAASVERALARGAVELLHGRDGEGRSQWAVLRDPYGASFGLIPVVPADALPSVEGVASPAGVAGRIAWLDLTVADAAAARDFYSGVVGWTSREVAVTEGGAERVDFEMLDDAGNCAAGICHARGANAGLPAVWLLYLPVGDIGESLRRVEEEGGRIVKAVQRSDGAYSSAVIEDPVGAYFTVVAS